MVNSLKLWEDKRKSLENDISDLENKKTNIREEVVRKENEIKILKNDFKVCHACKIAYPDKQTR